VPRSCSRSVVAAHNYPTLHCSRQTLASGNWTGASHPTILTDSHSPAGALVVFWTMCATCARLVGAAQVQPFGGTRGTSSSNFPSASGLVGHLRGRRMIKFTAPSFCP
jgi:hypothetical protein